MVGLVVWSAWQRWTLLAATPYPVGVDGWYYPIQIRALLERGELAYPAAPLAFWLMTPIAALSDPIVAAKVVAAVGGALVALPAFLLGRRIGGLAGGLVAAVVATTGGGSFYLSLEFIKNGLGLTVALTAVWLGLRALEAPGRGRIALAVVALVAAALTHKMSLLMAVALLAPAVVVEVRGRDGLAAATWRRLAIGGGAAFVLIVVAGVLAPKRFVGPADAALLGGAFTGPFEWALPAMAVPRADGTTYHLWLGHQGALAAAVALGLVAVVLAGRRWPVLRGDTRPAAAAVVWAALALVVLTSWPALDVADPDALGFRLRVAVFAPASIVAAAAAGRALAGLAAERRPDRRRRGVAPVDRPARSGAGRGPGRHRGPHGGGHRGDPRRLASRCRRDQRRAPSRLPGGVVRAGADALAARGGAAGAALADVAARPHRLEVAARSGAA